MNAWILLCICLKASALRLTGSQDDATPNLVMIAELTENYLNSGLFQNWVHYATPFINESTLVLFDTIEDTISERISSMNLKFKFMYLDEYMKMPDSKEFFQKDNKPKKIKGDPTPYGSKAYKNLMNRRPLAIKKILAMGLPVLSVDFDTVWAKNPFDEIEKAGVHDLLITQDGPTIFCGCFLFFRPVPNAISFAEKWAAETAVDAAKGNQISLSRLLKEGKQNLDFHVLPQAQFPPGNSKTFSDPTVYHANWMKGVPKKVDFFKRHGLWNPEM